MYHFHLMGRHEVSEVELFDHRSCRVEPLHNKGVLLLRHRQLYIFYVNKPTFISVQTHNHFTMFVLLIIAADDLDWPSTGPKKLSSPLPNI